MDGIPRIATNDDIGEFRRLWKLCFEDSENFMNWFFENRFFPEYSCCISEGGELVSAMQGVPYSILVRGKPLSGLMLCGVTTDPAHRRKGLMHKTFSYEMNMLSERGYALAVHTPAVLESYFSFGHLPVADANYFMTKEIKAVQASTRAGYRAKYDYTKWENLFPLYLDVSKKYSGIIQRTKEEFMRKCHDYAADGGKCFALEKNDEIVGYLFYGISEHTIFGAETIATNGHYSQLLTELFSQYEGYGTEIKLPPDLFVQFPFGRVEKKQKGVAGLLNIQPILESFSFESNYTFALKDDIINNNNGIFDMQGRPSALPPAFSISSGHFLQVLIGYTTLQDLKEFIEIFDLEGFESVDSLLPKSNCYIVDEY